MRKCRLFSHQLPAILAYHGQAYKHLKAETLTVDDLNVAQGKLWITSFLYGLLRPLDAILPYRMEGHVELPSGEGQNMFGFWKSRLTDNLIDAVKADDDTLNCTLDCTLVRYLLPTLMSLSKRIMLIIKVFALRKRADSFCSLSVPSLVFGL